MDQFVAICEFEILYDSKISKLILTSIQKRYTCCRVQNFHEIQIFYYPCLFETENTGSLQTC